MSTATQTVNLGRKSQDNGRSIVSRTSIPVVDLLLSWARRKDDRGVPTRTMFAGSYLQETRTEILVFGFGFLHWLCCCLGGRLPRRVFCFVLFWGQARRWRRLA